MIKNHITGGLFVFLLILAWQGWQLKNKLDKARSEIERLKDNQAQLLASRAQDQTLILTQRELTGKVLAERDSLAKALKIRPKEVIKFVDRIVKETNFDSRLQELIDYILSRAPSVQIIFTGCFWTDASKDLSISTVCITNSLPYDELATLDIADNRINTGDTVYDASGNPHTVGASVAGHPNNAGMAAIEGKIYDLLEPYLV